MSKYILAIDQGTTGTTLTILDRSGQAKARVNQEYRQIYPKPGWVEHDPEDIWHSVENCLHRVLEAAGVSGREIAAIGVTNQRETVMIWDRKTHRPLANAIVWQCRRTTEICAKLKKRGYEKLFRRKTGLVLDPYFSGTKIKWLLDEVSGAKARAARGELAAGTVDSFLIWRLSGGKSHVTDVSNASRTLLMNIHKGEWDEELMKILGIPSQLLPQIRASSGEMAVTRQVPGLPDGIPISGVAGDQQAALFGQTCFTPGLAKCTFGTGSFILLNTGSKAPLSRSGILTTVAWQLKGEKKLTYALEGGAFICGAAVQWLRDGLGIISKSSEVEVLASKVSDSGGVEFVPALTGLGAPHWDPHARGMISGLTRGSTKAHIARATLEAMALQNVEILLAMQKDLGRPLRGLRVDGGAAANNLLMQMQADFLGQGILRPKMIETTVAGAAYLAGLGVGFWSDLEEIKKVWAADREFQAQLSPKLRGQRLQNWQKAISRVRL